VPELFLSGQYLSGSGFNLGFVAGAWNETGRFLADPYAARTDLETFHAFMMAYLNL
jgi:hypothetical protein